MCIRMHGNDGMGKSYVNGREGWITTEFSHQFGQSKCLMGHLDHGNEIRCTLTQDETCV